MKPALQAFWHRYGLTAILSALVLAIGLTIGFETGWGQSVRPLLTGGDKKNRAVEMVATLPSFSLASLETGFRESGERPLFTPSRRPAAANLAAAPVMKKGQFRLTGTSVSSDLNVAYLLETASGKTVRVAKGKEINGITLESVENSRVLLRQGEESEELVLKTAASPPRPPAAMPGTPGQAPAGAAGTVAAPGQPVPRPAVVSGAMGATPLFRPQDRLYLRWRLVDPNSCRSLCPLKRRIGVARPAAPQAQPSAADAAATAQRRRRFQNLPQQ